MDRATYQREWRKKNPQKTALYCKKYKEANLDTVLVSMANWRSKNKEKLAAYDSKWAKDNKDKANCRVRNRRAKLRKAEGSHSSEDILIILNKQNYLCNSCRVYLDKYDIDHIIPLIKGGSNSPENLQILCPHCNRSKNDKTMEEWHEYKERLKTKNG